MNYTLRQVKPLLSAAELAVFTASTRNEIGSFTPRELRSKVTRARTLRDKFRDLYQRQTVAVQRDPEVARKPMGGENERTQQKADIFTQALQRFEEQLGKAETKVAKNVPAKVRVPKAPGVPATRTNPKAAQTSRRSSGNTPATGAADMPMRGATKRKKADVQRAEELAVEEAANTVKARGKKSKRSAKADAPKAKNKTKTKVKVKDKTEKSKKAKDKSAKASKVKTPTIAGLTKAVKRAVAKKKADTADAQRHAAKGIDAEVSASPSAAARGAVPIAHTARAARLNTLKEKPQNLKIHASTQGRKAHFQAKKDGR